MNWLYIISWLLAAVSGYFTHAARMHRAMFRFWTKRLEWLELHGDRPPVEVIDDFLEETIGSLL